MLDKTYLVLQYVFTTYQESMGWSRLRIVGEILINGNHTNKCEKMKVKLKYRRLFKPTESAKEIPALFEAVQSQRMACSHGGDSSETDCLKFVKIGPLSIFF